MQFGLFTPKEPLVSCVMLNTLVFVKWRASGKSVCAIWLQGAARNQQTTRYMTYRENHAKSYQLTANDGRDLLFGNLS